MRKSILLPVFALACAGDMPDTDYRVIPDFQDRSVTVACEPVDLGDEAPDEVRSVTDTSFLVLNAAGRRITEYTDRFQTVWSLQYSESGPAAIDRPVSAGLLGDTAVAVATRTGLKLVILDRAGGLIRAIHLGFIPAALAATHGQVLLTPMPVGDAPGTLLVRFGASGRTELPVPKRRYADMTIGALGNTALIETFPDGTAVLVHQFFAPRGFRASHNTGWSVSPLTVPTPDATADLVAAVPRPPLTTDQLDDLLVPALAMSVDRGRGEVYLMTRSGRWHDDRAERAVMRLDGDLKYLASYILDVYAKHMVVLPRREALLVADDLDRFHLCPLHADHRAE